MAGVERFIIEFFRAKDDAGLVLGTLTMAQGIALAILVLGAVVMLMRSRTGPGKPGIYAHT
jgi:prolipoprotein diacylglyceryltransferase